jgi:nicotianamine synthase
VGPIDHPRESATASQPSIHRILARRLARLADGDRHALDPGRRLDATLNRLVSLILSPAGTITGAGAHDGPVAAEVAALLARGELRERARAVRRASGLAETRMEHHYAQMLEHRWRSDHTAPARRDGNGSLARLFQPFPYTGNYLHLVDAELGALAATGRPVTSAAVCGAGPLPLSGLLLHDRLGCPVALVDSDPAAACRARTLVEALEQRNVVAPEAITVHRERAEHADLDRHDVVLVASLVPNEALLALADRLAHRPVTVLARSARGLVAHLAYQPIDPAAVARRGLRRLGAVLPDNTCGLAAREPSEPEPLAIAHHTVLNTTEVFARA